MADERDPLPAMRLPRQLIDDRVVSAAWRQRGGADDRRGVTKTAGEDISRLAGTHEGAGEDDVAQDIQRIQRLGPALQTLDAARGQRALGVVRKIFPALRGKPVADEIELELLGDHQALFATRECCRLEAARA